MRVDAMESEVWEKRLCNLIKKYKASSDVVTFRNEYRDVLKQATQNGKVSAPDEALLLEARDYLEQWIATSQADPTTAFAQWQKLYDAGKNRIPTSLLVAFLRR